VAILALEPDPARAATIRHIVCDVLRSELRIVGSKDRLLEELSNGVPDVMLVPALLTSADETELLTHLSTLHDSGHVEILVTPFRFASENQPRAIPKSWRTWWRKGQPAPEVYACDPRGFAEQLGWSLQRAQQMQQERVETCPPASSAIIPEVLTTADAPALAPVQASDRRAHRRFAADELHGLRSARIKYGPSVRLVDCSIGGALIESEMPLKPESEAMLEIIGDSYRSTVPFRVVRCYVSTVESRVLYWGACAFTQPLKLADLLHRRSDDLTDSKDERADRFDIAVRGIVERHVSHADRDGQTLASARASQTTDLSALLSELSRSRSIDPGEHWIKGMLAIVITALQRGGEQRVAFRLIEEQLDAALPGMTCRFSSSPTVMALDDKEVLYLKVPTSDDTVSQVLNVELPKDSMLEDWHFRLLKASTYLAAFLPSPRPIDPPGERQDRRRHVRVRQRLDGRRVGAIAMRLVIHDISETGCFVESTYEEESGRRLTLEVHLPDEGWITVSAEVVCNRAGGFAVRFIDVSDEIRGCLARMVAARTGSGVSPGPSSDPLSTAGESPAPQFAYAMIA
jgi:PilZ domain